jgi:TonB-linked SusC/RagA family outer membrane protein
LSVDERWGNFPSISAGWRISSEEFFDISWINDLKLRANYGTLGSSNIGYYDYQSIINTNPKAIFGTDQHQEDGMTQVKLVNTNLGWETMVQQNYGFDATFLNNHLAVGAEYYNSMTKNILVSLPILASTGNDGGSPMVNAASLQNTGIETVVTWRDQVNKDFKYSVTVNYNRLRNKVLEFGYGRTVQYTDYCITEIGQPIGMFHLIQCDGLFQNEAEIQNHKNSKGQVIQPNARPGDIRYVDADDNGIISTDGDRQIVGNPWPVFDMGLNVALTYKNFDFTLSGYGSFGQDVYNRTRWWLDQFCDNSGYRTDVNPWTPENNNTDFPRVVFGDDRNATQQIDRWVEDGSFFKISTISLGYTFTQLLKKYVKDVRLSVTGQNLFTFTKYTGLDPDFKGSLLEHGVNNTSFPSSRSFIFSLNVNF